MNFDNQRLMYIKLAKKELARQINQCTPSHELYRLYLSYLELSDIEKQILKSLGEIIYD